MLQYYELDKIPILVLANKIDLTDMCLFSIDSNNEKSNLSSPSKILTPKSKFKLYYQPRFAEKIIHNTNAEINLEYIQEFQNNKKDRVSKK